MKKTILLLCSLIFIYSCSDSVGQLPSEEIQKEKEFNELMKKVNETRVKNAEIIDDVSKKTNQIVQQTSETINSLKDENKKLKKEINETGKKYYPIDDTISNIKFTLRPVSGG